MRETRYTANFAANLETISEFFVQQDASAAAQRLSSLMAQVERAAALIAQFPEMGRVARFRDNDNPRVRAASDAIEGELQRAHVEALREYTLGAYWVLYAVQAETITFLAIRSARQTTYDR